MLRGDEETVFFCVLLVSACGVGYGSGCVISFLQVTDRFDVHICSIIGRAGCIFCISV